MRINKFIALCTGMSRRTADTVIAGTRVTVNGQQPRPGQEIGDGDTVLLDGIVLKAPAVTHTILVNKPAGYVVSRDGQGSRTIYDLLPTSLHHLKPVGRLDKDSSGLLVLTTDGELANRLTHPSYRKVKVYEVRLDRPLTLAHRRAISSQGVQLTDGPSRLELEPMQAQTDGYAWRIRMQEGRNRQIRRTFAALGYRVAALHRTHFGAYSLGPLPPGQYKPV